MVWHIRVSIGHRRSWGFAKHDAEVWFSIKQGGPTAPGGWLGRRERLDK